MYKLVVSTAKSNVMVVYSKQRHALSGAINIDVHLGNENIKQSDCIDYLGVKGMLHWRKYTTFTLLCINSIIYLEAICP